MKCSNCGEELSPRAPYCGLCGTYAPGYESWGDQEVSGGQQNHFSANHSRAEYIDDYRSANGWGESRDLAIPDEEAHAHRPPPPRQSVQNADDEDGPIDFVKYEHALIALLGNDYEDYLDRFRSDSIFNGWGFFLGLNWYAYRGMLGLAIKLFLIYCIPCVGQIIAIYFHCTADKQYRKHIESHAQKLAQFEEGSQEWIEYVNVHGGTSVGSVFILWAIVIGVNFTLRLFAEIFFS